MNEGEKSDYDEEEKDYNYAVVPPNGGWGWMVVACAFYCSVVVDGIQLTFGVFLKEISKSFNTDLSRIALAGSLMFGVHLIVGPLCAALSTEFGLRPVTITGSIICCLGLGSAYFATGYWSLYITYGVLGGMGLGLIYMNCLIITGLYFTTLMPIAIGIVVCGTGVGTMLFAWLGYVFLEITNWQTSFLIQAGLTGSMGIAALAFKPLKPVKVKLTPTSSGRNLPAVSSRKSSAAVRSTKQPASKKGVVFVKKPVPVDSSITNLTTYQNLAWDGYLEDPIITDFKRKTARGGKCCRCSSCCKSRKTRAKSEVLILSEIKSEHPSNRRKSYVERVDLNDEKSEYELESVTSERESMGTHFVFEEVIYEKKERYKTCASIRRTLVSMTNCHLLKSRAFFIFTISGALQMAATLIIYIYEKDRCKTELGFSDEMSIYFLICLGGANTFWRLFLGGIATIPNINYEAITVTGIVIGGVATLLSGLSDSVYYQFGFCILFGLGMATFAVFRLILLLDLIETQMVENATGINLLFMGVTAISFPPLFGWLMEITQSYNFIFVTTGILMCVSGLMLIRLKELRRRELLKIAQRDSRNTEI
ncbi:hypothetical protein RUM43_013787 [Polyplax serrata]|uniref:Uncharacterized protein n=1 Tax=Polyplax serrata TaxID=468196 RepID=A0AAN8RY31_POLSC